MLAVSNSSPLIYLSALGDLNLIRQLIGDIAIPKAVHSEVVVGGHGQPGAREVVAALGDWISLIDINDAGAVQALMAQTGLQAGESEAIILAKQLLLATILLDDQRAVTEAASRAMTVVRTPALYVAAKRAGLIETVKPKLDALRSFGFHLRDDHYRIILDRAAES